MLKNKILKIGTQSVLPGESKDIHHKISENYLGRSVDILVRVISSQYDGPKVFLTGGIHGDEMNSIAIIKDLIHTIKTLKKGTLICIPVVNVFGFQDNTRYLPDRRDLNRCFPGNAKGSLADRLAYKVFHDVISKCDFGIDCHTAAFPRTNFPQLRADLSDPAVEQLAKAFNAPIIVNGRGNPKTLRASATKQGCPTIVYEAGEVNKFQDDAIRVGVKGIQNVLKHLGMVSGTHKVTPGTIIHQSYWVRSNYGGLLRLKVAPGDLVQKGDVLAVCENLSTLELHVIKSPYNGIVIGLTLRPAIQPGESLCHIGVISKQSSESI